MVLNARLQFGKLVKQALIVLLTGFTALTFAKTTAAKPGTVQASVVISDIKGGGLRFEANQTPLDQVLDTIANKTHVPIHYSKLPESLVTAACEGVSLKQVLECLLDNKADLVFRYKRTQAKVEGNRQVEEAWILSSKENKSAAQTDIPVVKEKVDKDSPALTKNKLTTENSLDRTEELLNSAQSNNPEERAEAIGALLSSGRKNDLDVKSTLEQALTDNDANVRAQAISTLSHREGAGAVDAIQEALQDSSEDVRIMAVEGITDDVGLLQQAINDSDESVRSLAETKLEILKQAENY